jgi:2-polyprenyl-3-methyl-5-hydroxy-6-metoxy-1,4-benzoquinol methylase
MVTTCTKRGLDVTHGEAIEYLTKAQANSFAVITCFHLLEHLRAELIIQLLKASFRCLKDGGLLILETPNPEDPYVGSCGFHLDPTHVRPLPWQLLDFFVEEVGFKRTEILRLNPLSGDGAPDSDRIGLDYAILAQKA